jgi:hypothetical protein
MNLNKRERLQLFYERLRYRLIRRFSRDFLTSMLAYERLVYKRRETLDKAKQRGGECVNENFYDRNKRH